jgi:peptide-methionine (R)-S-oxide reductase
MGCAASKSEEGTSTAKALVVASPAVKTVLLDAARSDEAIQVAVPPIPHATTTCSSAAGPQAEPAVGVDEAHIEKAEERPTSRVSTPIEQPTGSSAPHEPEVAPSAAPALAEAAPVACDINTCGCADGEVQLDAEAWIDSLAADVQLIEREWHARLSKEQFRVLRMKGTEEIDSGEYNDHYADGIYACAGCGQPIYDSKHKKPFLGKPSHGWPAFGDSIDGALNRHGKRKVEITCSGCGGHVGHVFKSSRYPKPTNERHCANSIALTFVSRA